MKRIQMKRVVAVLLFAGLASPAYAANVFGEWTRNDGKSRVRFAPCGGAICGVITWLKHAGAPAKIGETVFYDLHSSGGATWTGKAFNPEDGQRYSGKITLSGVTLTATGCAFGGVICRSDAWTRAN